MKKLFYYQIFHIKEFSYNVNVSQLLPLLWLIYIILVFFFINFSKLIGKIYKKNKIDKIYNCLNEKLFDAEEE